MSDTYEIAIDALKRIRAIAQVRQKDTSHLLSNPPQNAAIWDLKNDIDAEIKKLEETRITSALLTKREHFAAQAMAALITSINSPRGDIDEKWLAKKAYTIADEMIDYRHDRS